MTKINRIIKKYFSQTYSLKVYIAFINWLNDGESIKEKEDAFREIWDELAIEPSTSTEASFSKLKQRILEKEEASNRKKIIPFFRKAMRVASVLLIPFLLFSGAYLYKKLGTSEIVTVEFAELFVPNGEMRSLVLPDSSRVQLNSGSIIIYPKSFSGNTRDVFLNGEASFNVAHNDEKPFIVKTSDMDVEVLGTVFNVSSYSTDSYTATTLESGRVNVHMKNGTSQSFILEPNDQIMLDRLTGNSQKKTVDVENVMAWKKGYLMVDRMSITDIAKMLERKYDVTIYINSKIHDNQRITAKFKNNESLQESLFILQQLMENMQYKIEGNKVYIY